MHIPPLKIRSTMVFKGINVNVSISYRVIVA